MDSQNTKPFGPSAMAADLKPMILIVDDQASNVQVLFEIFKADYEICMATSGEDALLFCQTRLPDVMLLDVIMPGMNGFAVCRLLKADPRTREIPVIFVTGQDDPLEEAKGLDEGGVDFITKPFHAAVVKARVRTHLVLKQAAIAIAASEKRLQQITEAVPAMIGYIDHAQRYQFCNKHYQTILGLEQSEMLGRTLEEVFGARTYADMKQRVDQALAGTRVSFERTAALDGKTVYLQCDYVPDIADDGTVLGFYALIMDVTASRTTQQRLAESSKRLRTITENIPALVAQVDREERYLFVNAQFGKVFNKDPEAMVGHAISEEYSPELYAFVQPHIARVLAGGIAIFEGQTVVPGGQRYFQSTYIPDKNDDGAVQGFFSMTFDITTRRHAEIVQAENEKRLRTITDNLPALITYIDKNHRFQFVNATMQAWTGIPIADINGKSFVDVMGTTLYAERREHIERALAGERLEFEMTAEAFGQVRHIHSTYIPDFDEAGAVRGIYTLSSDISRMKAIEQELRKHARFDPLTGLPNRPHLYEIMDAALARGRRRQTAIAVFFLDIDCFKAINDVHGHANGDLVLQNFAARLAGAVRVTDTVARLAGDEFVIVLEDLKRQEEAEMVAQKVLEATRLPMPLEQEELIITTSVGMVFDTRLDHTASELIALADESLYQAKAAGKNTFRVKTV